MFKKCLILIMIVTLSFALSGQKLEQYTYVKERYEVKPTLSISKFNTKYEELTCVGLDPRVDMLEAVIEIKKSYGYRGGLCRKGKGSKEYVAFYIDYGSGFLSTGAPAEVSVYDLTEVKNGPVYYAVKKRFVPRGLQPCHRPQLVKVRAILSWDRIPTGPSFVPVWGNIMERWVQIRPLKEPPTIIIPYKPFDAVSIIKPPQLDVMPMVSLSPEIKKYLLKTAVKEKKVELTIAIKKNRKEFTSLISKNPNYFGAISPGKDPKIIKNAIAQLPESKYKSKLMAINTEDIICVAPLKYNTTYEELKCVGLYPEEDMLEGVIEIKRSTGYGSDLCRYGSVEYVAFHIDWGDGTGYQPEGIGRVRVHNIPGVNGKRLFYAVKAKIRNIKARLKKCQVENIVKVKAILSWNEDPSFKGYTFTPTWGNVLVRRVQIRSLQPIVLDSKITIVNEIHVDHISQGGSNVGLAVNMDSTFPFTFDRPFGGYIVCKGQIVSSGSYYRFRYSDDNGATWVTIKDKRIAMRKNPLPGQKPYKEVAPVDDDGWFDRSDYDQDKNNYEPTGLVYWKSYGRNGTHRLLLEVANNSKTVIDTDEIKVRLDNIGPALYYFSDSAPNFPTYGVAIKDAGGSPLKCEEIYGSNLIRIFGHFYDEYFDNFSLAVFGGNIHPARTIGTGKYDSISGSGKVWKTDYPTGSAVTTPLPALNGNIVKAGIKDADAAGDPGKRIGELNLCNIPQTPVKVKCAYGLRLYVYDKAIVGTVSGYQFDWYRHSATSYVTFNWDPVDPDPNPATNKSCK